MDYFQACIDKNPLVFVQFYHGENQKMKKSTEKAEKLRAGMGNLSEEGRDYITHMVRAMLFYQNSLDLPGETLAGRPGKAKKPPGPGSRKGRAE
jgi:hypothetical protein